MRDLKTQDNHLLGDFTIEGIERAKRGEPKVLVTFGLDSNGTNFDNIFFELFNSSSSCAE